MKIITFITTICLLYSCGQTKKTNIVTIREGGLIMKGDIVDDTFFNDTILYYDSANNLLASKVYKNGILNGYSTEFYPNGTPQKITDYCYGLKNGVNTYFYPTGKVQYKDSYYYNISVGPIEFFDQNGNIEDFYFADFQNRTLVHIRYSEWTGIKEIDTKCTNFTTNIFKIDSTDMVSVFLYLFNPPKFSFKYSVLKKKKGTPDSNYTKVRDINDNSFYTTFQLPVLPIDQQYAIGLDVYDSILNKEVYCIRFSNKEYCIC